MTPFPSLSAASAPFAYVTGPPVSSLNRTQDTHVKSSCALTGTVKSISSHHWTSPVGEVREGMPPAWAVYVMMQSEAPSVARSRRSRRANARPPVFAMFPTRA